MGEGGYQVPGMIQQAAAPDTETAGCLCLSAAAASVFYVKFFFNCQPVFTILGRSKLWMDIINHTDRQ